MSDFHNQYRRRDGKTAWCVEVGYKTMAGVAYPVVRYSSKHRAEREYRARRGAPGVFKVEMYRLQGRKKTPHLLWRAE